MDFKFFMLITAFVLSSGCASKFYIPGNRFMSPESTGDRWKTHLEAGVGGVTEVQVADDITLVSPNTTPNLIKNSALGLALQVGLSDRFELYFSNTQSAPTMGGIKYQLIGSPQTSAKDGNFSLGLAAGYGWGSTSQSTTVNSNTGDSKISFSAYEAMVLIGYRVAEKFLIYVNPFYTHVSTKVTIQRTSSGVVTTTSPDGDGNMTGAILGFRFGKDFFLATEASFTNTKYSRTNPTTQEGNTFTDTALGVGLGWVF